MEVLTEVFYKRSALEVAQDLLGSLLVYETVAGRISGKIVETEAYGGVDDLACHASSGIPTKRTAVMFGAAGRAYVYLIYGMYYCFNIVTAEQGNAQAVLIRALEPIEGIEIMQKRRKQTKLTSLCSGPGKLCQALGIDKKLNGVEVFKPPLYIIKGTELLSSQIIATPRINVDYAKHASEYEWRFIIKDNKYISK